jgi:beta-barrel assembly-enhancing protease
MEIENRLPAENINAHPEKLHVETLWMLMGGFAALAGLLITTWLIGNYLSPLIPFEYEVALAKTSMKQVDFLTKRSADPLLDAPRLAAEKDLQRLANALREPLRIPTNMPITVHLSNQTVDNAFATVGGNIVLYKGLLARLQTEAAITALLAHEMAHVKHRHVARTLGRALSFAFVASLISSDLGGYFGQAMLNAEGIAMASFSREQEQLCDQESMEASQKIYGHVYGVADLMLRLDELSKAKEHGTHERASLLRTHPYTNDRIAAVQIWQKKHPTMNDVQSVTLAPPLQIYLATPR